jgi:hypothetical protein
VAEPRVTGLFTAPEAGATIESHEWIDVLAGVGVGGDRYALRRGYWSDPRWPDQEVTLVESEVAQALSVDPGQLRRNIVTAGIRLRGLIGARFAVGEAVFEGVRQCDPCGHLESLVRPGLLKELASRGGIRARVLTGGRVHADDPIRVFRDDFGSRANEDVPIGVPAALAQTEIQEPGIS